MEEKIYNREDETLKGTVQNITYRNDQNGYTVATVRAEKKNKNKTVVGIMPLLCEGESASFFGSYTVHPIYGEQFSAKNYERKPPETVSAILRYLSSGAIKGIGNSTAVKIVEKFGTNSLDIIENHPEELAVINGISINKALSIGENYKRISGLKDLMLLLSPYSVSPDRCVKIYKTIGFDCVADIKDNPYLLCEYDFDFSFETADKMAFDLGISADNEKRLEAGIIYILKSNLSNGHTCLPRRKLLPVAVKLLESDIYRMDDILSKMIASFRLAARRIGDDEFLALPEYFSSEEYIAARIRAVAARQSIETADELEIDYVENNLGIKFEKVQRDAVVSALSSNFMILTGGPGTGKTTTLNGIIQLFEQKNARIVLAAPTGRAAKRMTELTGRQAKTVHRLLEVEWSDSGKTRFSRNEKNLLACDVLIVDEASMLDVLLFEAILRAVKLSCKIILVGDTDQLPSILAGNVLGDLISSGHIKSVALKKVFRQSSGSKIISNAHAIINNTKPDLSNTDGDFFFITRDNANSVKDTILDLCLNRLPNKYSFDPVRDIQVLCPSRKFETGSISFNGILQTALNQNVSTGHRISNMGFYYYEGDKVMQIKNNYDLQWQKADGENGFGVFNGDVGYITDIDLKSGIVRVLYDDRYVTYLKDNLSEIEPAYAITVHKSQGSEFDCVIMPLIGIPLPLCYRNLLYTAVTRAKKLFIAVGDREVYLKMSACDKKTLRYTLLEEFLNEKFS